MLGGLQGRADFMQNNEAHKQGNANTQGHEHRKTNACKDALMTKNAAQKNLGEHNESVCQCLPKRNCILDNVEMSDVCSC